MKPAPARSWQRDLLFTALLWLLVVALDAAGIDFWLTRVVGSPSGFAWRDHWLTRGVLHEGGRVASWLLFGVVLIAAWRPWPAARHLSRRTRWWWLGCTMACAALISTLKQFSLTSCPWHLAEFGGGARWVSHWALGVSDGGPGRCFPSGHASGAFAFLAGYFALGESSPRQARQWLALVLALGFVFGWAQLIRGAHHASHAVWTGAICWSMTSLTYYLWCRVHARACSARLD